MSDNTIIESRYFNQVKVVNDMFGKHIVKSSSDINKMKAEYEWYHMWPVYLDGYDAISISIPLAYDYREYNDHSCFSLSYINGITLKEAYLSKENFLKSIITFNNTLISAQIDYIGLFNCFMQSIFAFLENSVVKDVGDYTKMLIESMYTYKTFKRLAETDLDLDKHYIVNSIETPTIRELVEQSYVPVRDEDIREFVHGDLCFSNIIFCPTKYALSFVDPRGRLGDNHITASGDIKYDVGKLAHSVIGLYDYILEDKGFYIDKISDYNYNYHVDISDDQIQIQNQFKEIFKKYEQYYYDIMIHLFLSMIPLHKDRPDHQEKFLINAFRIYFLKHNLEQ